MLASGVSVYRDRIGMRRYWRADVGKIIATQSTANTHAIVCAWPVASGNQYRLDGGAKGYASMTRCVAEERNKAMGHGMTARYASGCMCRRDV